MLLKGRMKIRMGGEEGWMGGMSGFRRRDIGGRAVKQE